MCRLPRTVKLMAAFAVAMMVIGTAAAQQGNGWYQSFEDAERAARAEGKPLLIHFQAWYCGPCRKMDSQVFHHRDVQDALRQGIVSVQIDVTREPEVAARYQASTVPRDVVVFPDGSVETMNVGFMPRTTYLGLLKNIESRGVRFSPNVVVATENKSEDGRSVVSGPSDREINNEESGGGSDSNARSTLLGLEGFCPVELHRHRTWIQGLPELTEEYRGVKYRFASEGNRDQFLKNPERFAPRNLGCDPVLLLASQKAITGKIQYGAFFDNQLYLFSSGENKQEFKKNPLKFTRIQHAVQVQNIEGTRFQ